MLMARRNLRQFRREMRNVWLGHKKMCQPKDSSSKRGEADNVYCTVVWAGEKMFFKMLKLTIPHQTLHICE